MVVSKLYTVVIELINGTKVSKFILAQNKYQAIELAFYREEMHKIQNNRLKYSIK